MVGTFFYYCLWVLIQTPNSPFINNYNIFQAMKYYQLMFKYSLFITLRLLRSISFNLNSQFELWLRNNLKTTLFFKINSSKPFTNHLTITFLPMLPSWLSGFLLKKIHKKQEVYWLIATLLKIKTTKCFIFWNKQKVKQTGINLRLVVTK